MLKVFHSAAETKNENSLLVSGLMIH